MKSCARIVAWLVSWLVGSVIVYMKSCAQIVAWLVGWFCDSVHEVLCLNSCLVGQLVGWLVGWSCPISSPCHLVCLLSARRHLNIFDFMQTIIAEESVMRTKTVFFSVGRTENSGGKNTLATARTVTKLCENYCSV